MTLDQLIQILTITFSFVVVGLIVQWISVWLFNREYDKNRRGQVMESSTVIILASYNDDNKR